MSKWLGRFRRPKRENVVSLAEQTTDDAIPSTPEARAEGYGIENDSPILEPAEDFIRDGSLCAHDCAQYRGAQRLGRVGS